MNCLICHKTILDNESRVTVFICETSLGDRHRGEVGSAHRRCAAEKWPDIFEDREPPRRL